VRWVRAIAAVIAPSAEAGGSAGGIEKQQTSSLQGRALPERALLVLPTLSRPKGDRDLLQRDSANPGTPNPTVPIASPVPPEPAILHF